ncbi:TetR/AcrR family transcriptional regulator [Sphingomonas sp. TX0543]|jgi:AcrR family transcriptional regulator|uniref:TetR/AcrR family transcriptional regulator n=1 Tax=Sphingomonadales TaxID=204457 RepID=UPI001141D262|nr:TetR/AcrR family transcriptional regulator [Porphyrobacter sp. YT40]QDH34980.1 TetR/AcrR family transcriptional regulator [Porphyrobacter sp. YT40]
MESKSAVQGPVRRSTRREQREATRDHILLSAVAVLIECGVAGTTTLEVQKRSGVGRGTLLHHFPTHAELLSATVAELVRRNEVTVLREHRSAAPGVDPLAHAIVSLASAAESPSYLAELELWAVARADRQLHAALRGPERAARAERDRVVAALFAPIAHLPGCATVIALTLELVRGIAVSGVLRSDTDHRHRLLRHWIDAARLLLHQPPSEPAP